MYLFCMHIVTGPSLAEKQEFFLDISGSRNIQIMDDENQSIITIEPPFDWYTHSIASWH